MLGLDRHVSTQCVDYKTWSCACSHTKRRVSAHFLSYEAMLVTKFSIDKPKRCTTAWLNLRTLLSMQFFTYKVMSDNSGLTHAKHCDACSLWKDVSLHNVLTYMDVFAWNFSHRSTCLHTTCHTISYVVLDRHMFPHSVSTTRRVHERVHTLKDGCLYTFWLTMPCLCVTLNISPFVCHIISHRCSRNKVQHHNFLTYEPFSLCNFRLRAQIVT